MNSPSDFAVQYGPWAVVAGASAGLGAAFAHALAERGLNLVLLARRADLLETFAEELRKAHGVLVRTLACDLADPSFAAHLSSCTADIEVGLGVYNAAYSFVAKLFLRPLEDALRVVDVNVRGPLIFAHSLVPQMLPRKRGGLILMSSLAGFQGSPRLAAYAASKAFNIILGESLWGELRPLGISVLVSCAGAIRTPGYADALKKEAPGTMDPSDVVRTTLAALGNGPVVVPGGVNKLASFVMRRVLPRTRAIAIMDNSLAGLE